MSQIEVVLCQRIANLGTVGDRVFVKTGFARNYLVPGGLAVRVTAQNLKDFEVRRAEFEKQAQGLLSEAQKKAKKAVGLKLTIAVKTSVEGKLYGSVSPRDIVELANEAGIEIDKQDVHIIDGNIHQIGEYQILLQFHSDVTEKITLEVVSTNPEAILEAQEAKASAGNDEEEDLEDLEDLEDAGDEPGDVTDDEVVKD